MENDLHIFQNNYSYNLKTQAMKITKCFLFVLLSVISLPFVKAQTWSMVGGELNSHIEALYVYDDKLYLGGNFTNIDGDAAYGLAEWDGSAYSDRNTTLVDGLGVSNFGTYQGKLMAVGTFFHGIYGPGFVAEWDGTDFVGEEYKLNSNVYDILTIDDIFYVVGYFDEFEGTNYRHVAKFNGTSYETVGDGFEDPIGDLFYYDGDVIAGGGDGDNLTYLDGTTWKDLGTNGPPGATMAEFKGDLYAVGCFEDAVDGTARYIAKWDGSNWSDVGGGLDGGYNCARAILATSDYLYVAGQFTSAGGVAVNNIAKWDGENWSAVGDGIPDEIINCLAIYKDRLYAGPAAQGFTNHLWKFSEEITSSVSETEISSPDFSISPNPASGSAIINMNLKQVNETVMLISDLSGNFIAQYPTNQPTMTINLDQLANGIYIARLMVDGNSVAAKKIVVNN